MSDNGRMLKELAATGPHPSYADQLMLFGQFVGSWDLEMIGHPEDGTTRTTKGEWHFGWVLEGRAVQDVLIAIPPEDGSAGEAFPAGRGSTLRVYDPRMDAWWIVWAGPPAGEFTTLFARDKGDRIVLEGQWSIGQSQAEWVFFDITPRSFRWQGRRSDDGGKTWRLVEEMNAIRRDG